jgi:hypothetical protein
MNADLVFRVAVAISRGAVLFAGRISVGPFGPGRWACLDSRGRPILSGEERPAIRIQVPADRSGWSAVQVWEAAHDWSAFGAALAFVQCAPRSSVHRALVDLAKGGDIGDGRAAARRASALSIQ